MKISVLVENTSSEQEILSEHGLSLYIETEEHKILFDTGQSDAFAENADRMGIDLSKADMAILSHGHYDHGGGLKRFLEINPTASVYVNRHAFMPHYNGTEKYIGLDNELKTNPRIHFVDDVLELTTRLSLHSCNGEICHFPMDSAGLNVVEDGKLLPEDFRHEQYLLIRENNRKILISGCSHKGILNIMKWFEPDVLIGGFHFMKLNLEGEGRAVLQQAGETLLQYPARYYTGHCTGMAQYCFLKEMMGERLEYLAAGRVVTL